MHKVLGAIGAILIFSQASSAQEVATYANQRVPVEKCDASVLKHVESSDVRSVTHVFFLDLVDESNYEDVKKERSAELEVPTYFFFSGDWKEFKTKREQYKRHLEYRHDRSYSRQHAFSTLTEVGLEAYRACLESVSQATSLILYLERNSPTDTLVTVHLQFKEQYALKDRSLQMNVYGAELDDSTPPEASVTQTDTRTTISFKDFAARNLPLTFKRKGLDTEFRVVARFPTVGLSANTLVIKPAPKVKTITESKTVTLAYGPVDVSQPATSNQGLFWGTVRHCIQPESGWTFSKGTARISVVPQEGFCAQKPPSPTVDHEGQICFPLTLSLNAGNRCITTWEVEGRQVRTRQVFE